MLDRILFLLFFIGLFFFPFNCFDGIKELGEFKNESGSYFFLSGFILLFFSKKLVIPTHSKIFLIILTFLAWCFITTALNFPTVYTNYFKHTSGINRFIRQYFALLVSSLVFFLFYYNVLIKMELKEILNKIRKLFLLSLGMASIIGFFEISIENFGIGSARVPMKILNYFPFFEKVYFDQRTSAFADEPPFFAVYLITIAGWMFSYILTHKSFLKYLPTIVVLLLTFFSGSRTALIVVFIQLIIFILIITPRQKILKSITTVFSIALVFSLVTVFFAGEKVINEVEKKIESLDFIGNLKKNKSNQSRFGMQYAAMQVFYENPIIGVGFGQLTYHSRFHYPGWATNGNYEFTLMYRNNSHKPFPPSYNMYPRILSETGLVGFLIFFYLMYYSIKEAKKLLNNDSKEIHFLSIILIIALSGLFINLFQIDTFRLYGIWISLAILIIVKQKSVLK